MNRIILDQIKITFNEETLFELKQLEIGSNEVYPLLGLNGTGKSTLLRIIAGIIKPSEGNVFLDGSLLYQPQKPMIFNTSVLENAIIGMKIIDKNKALEILDAVGLKKQIHQNAKLLSGGQQQRLCLARSILTGGEILLFDEPFSAVDIKSVKTMEDFIKEYCKSGNRTLILSTHSIKTAQCISDRCLLLADGKLEICSIEKAREYLINII
jgi:ABC-type nitrate/sulfonate/bicarbonate transport system ATPase subunit